MSERQTNELPKVGEIWKLRNRHYRVDLVGDVYIILSAVYGDSDDGMILTKEHWGENNLRKVDKKDGEA